MIEPTVNYKRHRFAPFVIAQAVWLYFRFPLSLRLAEEILLERCIVVSSDGGSGRPMREVIDHYLPPLM